ncbi:outer membrane protein assembly factor BamA [Chromobacterium subtsugae]|uniref:Outer membrane protein assembly factor BamA n=1 Tax=Chromobacterium subtsugae TaxID=251747 RepID=A0ABS7FCX4_9NEIS|nr:MULTISPECIES: outer membrane protein assembly factor BamA [Chromobacterium]KUM01889.1 outer membrane protein assembly factor BamA [Chromobacterium subtsugae]KZE88217.1 outer membrane protein assembly factor BamA [Chromobacterium sp. F49]MBW7565602.1 outer membrane protein assembly factor BamA [Chromobacterium subtsugae]MBW8287933.1 outer membrane protein assembly factor BamA [Chromobacterium subtsugae]OBU86918.1 membrane protein [Chromobacterium subtsugae]
MKLKRLAAAVLGLSMASVAMAADPFVIKDIRVEGLQRTEPGTVFNYLPVKVGDTFTDAKAQESIKALFNTGFFNDVRVESRGDTLIVTVAERPVITQLNINGAKEFSKDQLKKALKDNGFAESLIFDQALLDGAVQELKRQYYSRGKYSVEITPSVTKLERNRVSVTLDINEGVTARIKEIRIVGANAFAQSKLLDEFSLTTGGWLSWITKDDQYSKQKLTGDLEKLKAFYQNQGYMEFAIDSSQVSISPDKQEMYLVINVHEGKKFTVSDVRLAGDLKVPEAELRKLVLIKSGDTFDNEKVTESVKAISDRLGVAGYAFANVNVLPDIDHDKQTAAFTFFVDPGRKTYVRRVNVAGNSKTRDEVIRRELRQLEGAPYNAADVKRSKERLELLGYFEDVNVETPAVSDAPDQVDMNISLKERSTGSISGSLGYVQGEGLVLGASISQSNIFGSGKYMSLSMSTGQVNKNYSLSFTDPYFTPDGVSLGYDIYDRVYNPDATSISAYKTSTVGADVRFGVPITEYDRINFTLGAEKTDITTYANSPSQYIDFVNKYGNSNYTVLGTVGWARDTRDSALWPTRGASIKVNADAGLPGGSMQYYRLTHQQTWFFPLSKDFTLMLNGELGYADGYGKTKQLPFFQNFYMGGLGSVRGYDTSSIGPVDGSGNFIGGNRKVVANAEILFPFPGMKDNKSLRTSLFFDAGTLWNTSWTPGPNDPQTASNASNGLRYSAGLALTWLSPMGPMKFSIANPLKKEPNDKIQRFQFQLGASF